MITFLSIVWLGFFLGMRHATDPDHVVAVSTIVSRERKVSQAAGLGVMWGIGHTLTLLVVGGGIFLCGFTVPKKLGLSMEFSVGIMLVILGALNLRNMGAWLAERASIRGPTTAECTGNEPEHEHSIEKAATTRFDSWFGNWNAYWLIRPLLIGLVHGLAGSAAVGLLVLPLIHKPVEAFIYLLVFGVGTIAGMLLVTAAIAVPFASAAQRSPALHKRLGFASGVLSVTFGLVLLYQIGFVQGLFTK
jgi:high-affinity nickel-transport protein